MVKQINERYQHSAKERNNFAQYNSPAMNLQEGLDMAGDRGNRVYLCKRLIPCIEVKR